MFHFTCPETRQPVFTATDPRAAGFQGDVQDGVTLRLPSGADATGRDGFDAFQADEGLARAEGNPAAEPVLGVNPADRTDYRVFYSQQELRAASFRFVYGWPPVVLPRWDNGRNADNQQRRRRD